MKRAIALKPNLNQEDIRSLERTLKAFSDGCNLLKLGESVVLSTAPVNVPMVATVLPSAASFCLQERVVDYKPYEKAQAKKESWKQYK